MDLLEYQGKQLFSKHGVPVPEGRAAASVPEAVEAADELGYPVVVKAQVLIGGRRKAGGLQTAHDRPTGAQKPDALPRMESRGLPDHKHSIAKASRTAG